MIRYLDTSVYAKTIVDEPDSGGVVTALDEYRGAGDELVSSAILGRARPDDVRAALDLIDLVKVTDARRRGSAIVEVVRLRAVRRVPISR